jgi:hypothetical protein
MTEFEQLLNLSVYKYPYLQMGVIDLVLERINYIKLVKISTE